MYGREEQSRKCLFRVRLALGGITVTHDPGQGDDHDDKHFDFLHDLFQISSSAYQMEPAEHRMDNDPRYVGDVVNYFR